VIWSQPEDFRWLALGSVIVLGVGTTIFGVWSEKVRRERLEVRYEEIVMDDVEDVS
jgi:iron-regulated transporter 1